MDSHRQSGNTQLPHPGLSPMDPLSADLRVEDVRMVDTIAPGMRIPPKLPGQPPTRARFFHTCLLAVVVVVTACSDTSDPPACSASAVGPITIGAGTTPTISWAANCPAVTLAVYQAATGIPVWEIRADRRQIPKPVTYGIVPGGVFEEHPAEALQAGTAHGVYVQILIGTDTLGAIAGFTP